MTSFGSKGLIEGSWLVELDVPFGEPSIAASRGRFSLTRKSCPSECEVPLLILGDASPLRAFDGSRKCCLSASAMNWISRS